MKDISKTVEPKSDQLNYDDLIGGVQTLEVTGVKVVSGDQPVHIEFAGGEGKPFKPCKSMRRVLILAWGKDGDNYVGKKMKVYGDPKVKWAGSEIGGIRISHMSDLEGNKPIRVMLTETRGKRSPYTVEPLISTPKKKLTDAAFKKFCAKIDDATTMDALSVVAKEIKDGDYDDDGSDKLRRAYSEAVDVIRNADDETLV